MKRLPPSPRRKSPALPLLAALILAAPALSAQTIDQRYDPANVNNNMRNIANPQFQRRMTQSAQSVAESLVGRPANATDQRILGQFTEQQTRLLQQMQNAANAMPDTGAGAAYNRPSTGYSNDMQFATPEERYLYEERARAREESSRSSYRQNSDYPQGAYQPNGYRQNNGYPGNASPYDDYQNNGYPQQGARSSTGQALGGAVLLDLTNAAIQRATQPKIIYRQAPPPPHR
ncbi:MULTISPECIES: hypothetical protein [Lysobacter]|uniref:hypothetical protein n=1 Tax=Lysobacter TaxID=68 RepID=UPI001F35AAC1|nr:MULTISPECIES: hypothetical protein [Lysobacter]UJB18668.1 hypothetical protein L1A79_20470 [Lysobacter capsici]UJQ27607.1 hypothetical protein L2D09_19415 [Lysobacter gummosus]